MLENNDRRWILGTLVGLILAFSGFVVLLWQIELLDLPETDPGAKAFAAVLALLGGVFTAALTFIGVLLKLSSDGRTLELKREADNRTFQLEQEAAVRQREAEDRLKMDTCIQAVGLMGKEAGNNQMAGALFALANLGQLEFALALLERLWPNRELGSSAIWLVNEGLKHRDPNIQFKAAFLLKENSKLLKKPEGDFDWPDHLSWQWRPDLNVYARNQIFEALLNCLLSDRPDSWSEGAQGRFIVFFHRMMSTDEDPWITTGAAQTLHVLLDIYSQMSIIHYWKDTLKREQPVTITEIRKSAAEKIEAAKSQAAFDVANRSLEAWGKARDNNTA
jgi:hypothetical protein